MKSLVAAEVAHNEQSIAVCLSSRKAILTVEGDLLSLELLTDRVDRDLETAVNRLLSAINLFVPTSKGGRVPDRNEYKDFDVEKTTGAIEQEIRKSWRRSKDPG